MKISLVGPAFPYRGGIAHFTSMLAREFEKHHDVQIVNFRRLYPSFLFPGKTQFDDSDSPLRVDSVRAIDSMNPLSFWRAAREIADFRPDVVVFQWWQPFFGPAFRVISGAVKRRTSARIIFLCHNVLPHESSVFDRALIRIGLANADAFLVQSREDGGNLLRLRSNPTYDVNPHPIYDFFNQNRITDAAARLELGLDGPAMLFFGYIRAYKGLKTLLRAFAKVKDELPATLLVVGEFYEKRDVYDALIADLDLTDRVRVVDRYVPNEEVEVYFRAADVVVLPYLSATQSGIVQTAFSFARPVIVTAVGGLPDVVEDGRTGLVVPADDPDALAGAIRRFYREDLGDAMADRIRAGLDRFSWRHCADTLLELAKRTGEDG